MAISPRTRRGVTLEEFLLMPDIDESPGLEYIDGRIEAKVAPQKKHSVLTIRFVNSLDRFAGPLGLGMAFVELRCTFAGRSIVPDVVFLKTEHILVDASGEFSEENPIPPDIHVEIVSPRQSYPKTRAKLAHSTANGCPLGWLVHPDRRTIDVYRAGHAPERLAPEGAIVGEPVLPGFVLPVAEVSGWLTLRVHRPGADPA